MSDKFGYFGDMRQMPEFENLKCGAKKKFVVLKISDINEALNGDGIEAFVELCNTIAIRRQSQGKSIDNEYIVANVDEPYAPEIIEIMKRNGHWG